ncbi:hypothetical protein KIPB_011044, partial [Kipferlia bialata]|eukprot:g11044.t1
MSALSEKEKCHRGMLYDAQAPELVAERTAVKE